MQFCYRTLDTWPSGMPCRSETHDLFLPIISLISGKEAWPSDGGTGFGLKGLTPCTVSSASELGDFTRVWAGIYHRALSEVALGQLKMVAEEFRR